MQHPPARSPGSGHHRRVPALPLPAHAAARLPPLPSPRRLVARLVERVLARRALAPVRPIKLALQGGGAHGAFTWGVLDRLLEDERLRIEALSGASAGAMNAVVLASGWLDGGREGARAALAAFWHRVADAAALLSPFRLVNGSAPQQLALSVLTRLVSPYQFNPLELNPLRRILADSVDFERLRDDPAGPELLIAATRLRDGRCRVFERREISADVVLASACLPSLHHAVAIDGEPYWDGGFSANPPLLPLVERGRADADVLLVQINPATAGADEPPVTAPGIADRLNELVFNAPLAAELDALALGVRLARDGGLRLGRGSPLRRRLARLRLHRIDGAETLRPLGASSKLHPDRRLLTHMRDRGHEAADRWLADHFPALGRRSTLALPPP